MKALLLFLSVLILPAAHAANPLVKQISKQKFEVSRSAAEKEDGMAQLTTFTAMPSFAQGPFTGLSVSHFSSKCMLPKFGLKEGDVVTNVQGIDVRMPSDVIEIGKKLSNAKPGTVVRVKILRDGDELPLNYMVVE